MPNVPEEAPILIVDNRGAPDVFADRVIGAFLTNGNAHMTFVSRRCDYTKQPPEFADVVIGRLVMPFVAAEEMARFLGDYVLRMKAVAVAAAAPPPDDTPRTIQ